MSKNSLEDFASYHTKKSKPSKPQHSSHRNDPQPSSPQYSDLDREKLEILKQHNLTLINNLFPSTRPPMGTDRSKSSILEDEAQSIRSESESQYSSNHDSRGQSQQPNSHQSLSTNKYWTPSLGPILSRSNQVDEETSAKRGGLMSFRGGSPGDAVSNSTLRTLSKTVGVEKFAQESYFEYSDFDAYAEAMSRRLSEVDIKSKFSELKHSANLLKMIAEAGPEEDIDQIFNKHMTPELANAIDSSKPLYKMVSEAGLNQSAMKNIRAEQMLASKRQSIQESSRGNIARDVNSIVLGPSKKKLSNHYLTLDSQNKLSDKHESFEAFLLDQGVGASIYNNAGKQQGKEVPGSKGSGQYEGQSMGNIQPDNNSFSFIKQIDENASVMHNSQAGGMSADLHMFLMQNLREIMEVKDILRDGIGYGALESRDNLKTSRENDGSAIFVQNSGEDQFEQKLQEGQMERLVNKVKTLNEKLKKYEQESVETKRMTQAMKKCLRIGKVKMSDLIGVEVDISGLTLEHLYSHYSFQQKYIYVYTTHLSICNDAAVAGEQEQKFHYSEIEQVYFLEKPRSTFFMLKLLDKESDKSWGQDSIKESFKAGSQIKTRTLDTLSHFYFLEIEDQSEMAAWDLAFFIVNFKIISGHLSFSVNKNDFLTMMKALVQKYIATYGETSRPLSDLGASGAKLLGLNNSPPLSRMGSTTSEQASEKLGILDILNRKRMNGNPNVGNVQLPAFVKKRSDDGEKPEIKEEPSNPANRKVFQKQKSLPLRGMSAEDDLSSVEEGNSMSEENAEDSPDAREEKNKAHFIKALSKGPTLELDDDVFSRYLGTMAEGMVLLKHGKWGKSHDRLVRLSDDYAAIQWTHPLKPNKRKGVIDISTVYSVLIGKKSMYFSKKNMSPSELELCFSIVGKARSLHLQATNLQSRNYFIEALEYILKERNQLKKIAEQNNRARKAS